MQVTPGLSDYSSQGIGWLESADTERHEELCCGWICTKATLGHTSYFPCNTHIYQHQFAAASTAAEQMFREFKP